MTLKVCDVFKEVEKHLSDNFSFEKNHKPDNIYTYYCQTNKKIGKGNCLTVGQVVNVVTILLLDKLFVLNRYLESENKNNEYITYIMLWLSNKMKLIKYTRYGSVEDFYVTFIKDSKRYKLYHDKINKNKKIMKIKINEMRKLYELLNDLCNAITKYNKDSSNYIDFSNFVNNWTTQYIQLVSKKTYVFEDEYYCDVLMTLQNAYEKFKKDNGTKQIFPEIINIEKIKTCEELGKEAKRSSKVIGVDFKELKTKKDLGKGEDTSRNIDLKNAFEIYSLFFSRMFTNIRDSLYENVLPTLKDFYGKLKNSADNTISYVNELKKTIETLILDNCMPEKKETGSESPSPSSSTEHTRTSQSSSDLSENGEKAILWNNKYNYSFCFGFRFFGSTLKFNICIKNNN
ncbi:hypothetical protein YYC_02187 [Plasmodium yoelii 17X]|uniref:Uncharacterized protein n=1 Tax=Plasmodium yoelii 17X TaxID=1323249 RepID=V7PMW1_PLAYE|nr:hypothetical protein YYC_02187 [Plasmodium yoelii 17X]